MPISTDPAAVRRDDRRYGVIGRLKPGVSVEQANGEIRSIVDRLARSFRAANAGWSARVAPTREAIAGSDTWVILALLSLVVGFVLLIACANVTNLALARVSGAGASWRSARRSERRAGARCGCSSSKVSCSASRAARWASSSARRGLRLIRAAAYEPFFELSEIDRTCCCLRWEYRSSVRSSSV